MLPCESACARFTTLGLSGSSAYQLQQLSSCSSVSSAQAPEFASAACAVDLFRELCRHYDTRSTGVINLKQLSTVLWRLGLRDLRALDEVPGATGDGIAYETFLSWLWPQGGAVDSSLGRGASPAATESSSSQQPRNSAPLRRTLRAKTRFLDGVSDGGKRPLILHFDVNKTIVMKDSIKKNDLRHVANQVIGSASWGKVDAAGNWTLVTESPNVHRPSPELVSYNEHMDKLLPGRKNKVEREGYLSSFTEPGQPGESLKSHCEKILDAMKLPEAVIGSEAAKAAGMNGHSMLVVPSFYELLLELKRTDHPFFLLFRSFGSDLEEVAVEFNAFCEGRHPLFPDAIFDGRDGDKDYRIDFNNPDTFGTLYRSSVCSEGAALVLGTHQQPERDVESLDFYSAIPNIQIVSGGFEVIYNHLLKLRKHHGTIALRDFWPLWRSLGCGEGDTRENGGKLLIIDTKPSTQYQQIFFDDNIMYSHAKIVDVRERSRPERAVWTQYALPCHLVRCEPLEAVGDRRYFIDHVQRLVHNYEARLKARTRCLNLLAKTANLRLLATSTAAKFEPPAENYNPWESVAIADWDHDQVAHEEGYDGADGEE